MKICVFFLTGSQMGGIVIEKGKVTQKRYSSDYG
jgi:hypothetical protein